MPGVVSAAGSADELGQLKETLLTLPEEVIKDVGLEATAATTSESVVKLGMLVVLPGGFTVLLLQGIYLGGLTVVLQQLPGLLTDGSSLQSAMSAACGR